MAKVLVISCNWDGWSCIDAASAAGHTYAASVSVAKLNCLSGINAGVLLKAFDLGIDAVMLLGCVKGQCLHGQYDANVESEATKARSILGMLGMDKDRIVLSRLEPFDGDGFTGELARLQQSLDGCEAST